MTPVEIVNAAIAKMNKKITNEIFLIIQNDPELMYQYLRSVERDGLDKVYQDIGRIVKSSYHLVNDGRENNPTCTLIQSHQKFE